jgi:hypothetical protein
MYGLTADTECLGNGLPTPTLLTGIRNVNGLQPLLKSLQRAHNA